MPRTRLSAKTDAASDRPLRSTSLAPAIHGGRDGAAKAAGMSRSTIYARIKDLPSCSGKEIAALARVTRIPVDELFALWAKAC